MRTTGIVVCSIVISLCGSACFKATLLNSDKLVIIPEPTIELSLVTQLTQTVGDTGRQIAFQCFNVAPNQIVTAWVPFLGGMVMSVIGAYLAIVEAHILGWTLYMNGEELGWD